MVGGCTRGGMRDVTASTEWAIGDLAQLIRKAVRTKSESDAAKIQQTTRK
jgi:hypothetical protein